MIPENYNTLNILSKFDNDILIDKLLKIYKRNTCFWFFYIENNIIQYKNHQFNDILKDNNELITNIIIQIRINKISKLKQKINDKR